MITSTEKVIYSCVVVFAVGFGMYAWQTQKTKTAPAKVITYKDLKTVRNSAIAQDKIEKQKVQVTNWKTAPQLDSNVRELKNGLNETTESIRIESQKNVAAIDAAEGAAYEAPISSLETQINKKLVNDQVAVQMSQMQKNQFIDNYKKRALSMGYVVELNDQLELIKATKIPSKPSFNEKAPASVDVDSMEEDDFGEEGE